MLDFTYYGILRGKLRGHNIIQHGTYIMLFNSVVYETS